MKKLFLLAAVANVLALLILMGYGGTPTMAAVPVGARRIGTDIFASRIPPASNATKWYTPLVFRNHNGWNSFVWVQNTSGSVETIGITSYDSSGNSCATMIPNVPNRAWVHSMGCLSSTVQSVIAVGYDYYTMAPRSVVAYVESYGPNASDVANGTQSTTAYYGIPVSATLLYNGAVHIPFIYNNGIWRTGIVVQNAGSAAADFTVHYSSSTCTDNLGSIAPGSSASISPGCVGLYGGSTAAWVTNSSNQPTALAVSQLGPHGNYRAYSMGAGFGFTSLTPIPVLADNWQQIRTGVVCVNAESAAGTITLRYATGRTDQISAPPGAQVMISQAGTGAYPKGMDDPNFISSTKRVNCMVSGESDFANNKQWDGAWGYTVNNLAYAQPPAVGVAAAAGDVAAVDKTEARWYLNWAADPTGSMPTDVEFVPMDNASYSVSHYSTNLMGVNEPNIKPAPPYGDTHVCPSDYVQTWFDLRNHNDNQGFAYVSPGVGFTGNITCTSPSGQSRPLILGLDWLQDFKGFYEPQHGSVRWTVAAFHFYRSPEAPNWYELWDDEAARKYINQMGSLGVGELWLNEWDAGKWGSQNLARERQWLDYLAVQPKITRFAYYQDFNAAQGDNSALVKSDNTLSGYGKAYWMYR